MSTQDLGTFMIRFSESFPGLFAVAYAFDLKIMMIMKMMVLLLLLLLTTMV